MEDDSCLTDDINVLQCGEAAERTVTRDVDLELTSDQEAR
jgi:hypothetical protein